MKEKRFYEICGVKSYDSGLNIPFERFEDLKNAVEKACRDSGGSNIGIEYCGTYEGPDYTIIEQYDVDWDEDEEDEDEEDEGEEDE